MHHSGMRRILFVAALAVSASMASAEAVWQTSFEKAAKLSRQSGLPIMAQFTGSDWCPPCKAFEATILSTPIFESWAKTHVVLLKLDFPKRHPQPPALAKANAQLASRYQVAYFPTVLFIKADGQLISSLGFSGGGPTFWTKNAEIVMRSGAKMAH